MNKLDVLTNATVKALKGQLEGSINNVNGDEEKLNTQLDVKKENESINNVDMLKYIINDLENLLQTIKSFSKE